MIRVTGLFIYPVKSLRGCPAPFADFDELGFVGDRRFLVIDRDDRFLTQRVLPQMAGIETKIDRGRLTLSADGSGSIDVPTASEAAAPLRRVTIWKSEGLLAEDCGAPAAEWLSGTLGHSVRLVRIGPKFDRQILKAAARPTDRVGFADSVPFLIVSEASVADLNDRILQNDGEGVPMDRFRPNLVIAGCAAFEEDRWPRVQIGSTIFRNAGPCTRCIVTTTDQFTGRRGKEPLRTLATFRRDPREPADVNFGVNLIHEPKRGTVRVGDVVVPST